MLNADLKSRTKWRHTLKGHKFRREYYAYEREREKERERERERERRGGGEGERDLGGLTDGYTNEQTNKQSHNYIKRTAARKRLI